MFNRRIKALESQVFILECRANEHDYNACRIPPEVSALWMTCVVGSMEPHNETEAWMFNFAGSQGEYEEAVKRSRMIAEAKDAAIDLQFNTCGFSMSFPLDRKGASRQ